jgi:hypothetical protein
LPSIGSVRKRSSMLEGKPDYFKEPVLIEKKPKLYDNLEEER